MCHKANQRMRVPIMPFLALLAGIDTAAIVGSLKIARCQTRDRDRRSGNEYPVEDNSTSGRNFVMSACLSDDSSFLVRPRL
jgi:hypothetical protein